jgi:protein-histidine pros-kinase
LAEDNPTNQVVAMGLLERAGFRADFAANGREALAALARQDYDIILMDVQMPEMDGYEATLAIREQEKTSGLHIPIIAMTANAMKGDREKCLEAGMDDYISKPVRANDLITAIQRQSAQLPPPRVEPHPNEAPAADRKTGADASPPFDKEELSERMGGSAELLKTVVAVFLQDSPIQMGFLKDAIQARDTKKTATLSHRLRGAAASMSGHTVQMLTDKIETASKASDSEVPAALLPELEREFERLRVALSKMVEE